MVGSGKCKAEREGRGEWYSTISTTIQIKSCMHERGKQLSENGSWAQSECCRGSSKVHYPMATHDGATQRVAGVLPGLSGHSGANVTGHSVESRICTPGEKGKEPLDPFIAQPQWYRVLTS